MPNRWLREGILDSERINALDWPEEVFYRRLMSKVDDYGLFDARPAILRTTLYPLRVDRVREADIARWIATCEKAGVIALYVYGGKPYGQMLDTKWQARSEPKHPLPPWGKSAHPGAHAHGPPSDANSPPSTVNGCEQLHASEPVVVVEVDIPPNPPKSGGRRAGAKRCPEDFEISPELREWASTNAPDIDLNFETQAMKDFEFKRPYSDWSAVWRNWMREAQRRYMERSRPRASADMSRPWEGAI